MKLKSYFSGTVEAAIELAHQELGEDALLVNVRPAAIETRHLGAYEVVFGVNGEESGAPPVAASPHSARAASPSPSRADFKPGAAPDRWSEDLADLRRQLARLGDALRGARNYASSFAAGSAAARSETCARLMEAELDAELAQLVAQGTPLEELCLADATLGRTTLTGGMAGGLPGGLASGLANGLASGLARGPEGALAGAPSCAIVALVGPPGAGKTSTLVKLAARYGLGGRKRTHILSADVHRVAAAEQLRTLAAILGLSCDVVETPVALRQAIEEHRLKDLILIDTPGLGWADLEDGRELARMLAAHGGVDTHLVLPASMKPADIARVAEQFAMFQPAKLIFTRLDETTRFGALVSESVRTGRPVSFLTTGQEIPDALEAATSARLAELVRGGPADPGCPVPNLSGATPPFGAAAASLRPAYALRAAAASLGAASAPPLEAASASPLGPASASSLEAASAGTARTAGAAA